MRGPVHVWPDPPRRTGDVLEVAAELHWPFALSRLRKPRRQRVWIRVPAEYEVSEVAVGDAFLLGTVFGGMRLSGGIRLHARATAGLVENLHALQALWVTRHPDKYRPAPIECDAVEKGAPRTGPSVLAYSGGLDSSYSLHRHTSPDRPADGPVVGAAVMLHGADIPWQETAAFEEAFAGSRRMTQSRGVPLLRAVTNLRVVKQNWTHSCPATLAAVMSLLRSRFASGLVAVGFTVEEARQWWPQDLTDPPLLSSPSFPVIGDGYESDRFEKLVAIRDWPEAMESLRVCFRPGSWTGNCGACFKCQVAGLFARLACGGAPPFMPRAMTEADIRELATRGDRNMGLRLSQLLDHARRRGVRDHWIVEVQRVYEACGGR